MASGTLVVRVVVSACMCQSLDGGRREVGLTCYMR